MFSWHTLRGACLQMKIKLGSTVSTYIQAIHVNTLTALSKLQVTSVLVSAL